MLTFLGPRLYALCRGQRGSRQQSTPPRSSWNRGSAWRVFRSCVVARPYSTCGAKLSLDKVLSLLCGMAEVSQARSPCAESHVATRPDLTGRANAPGHQHCCPRAPAPRLGFCAPLLTICPTEGARGTHHAVAGKEQNSRYVFLTDLLSKKCLPSRLCAEHRVLKEQIRESDPALDRLLG